MPLKLDHDEFCNYPDDCVCARLGMARAHERRVVSRQIGQLKKKLNGDRACVLHFNVNEACAYCTVGLLFDAIIAYLEEEAR